MSDPRIPSPYGGPDQRRPSDPFADAETDAGVDAILRDDALLDALGRGELPATYRADVTARLLTTWRDDLDEGLPPLRSAEAEAPVLLAPARDDDTEVFRSPWGDSGDDTAQLPRLFSDGVSDPDRIDESVRSAFVAAGYARPTEQLPPVRPSEAATEQFQPSFDRLPPAVEEKPVTTLGERRPRRRRFDRVVVATAAVAAVLAAGSAGSVAAAATAHPGDKLWPISRVVYAERARSIEASEEAHASLQKAREALERGDTGAAQRYYDEAQQKLDENVREGSDEADRLADDLETTAAIPDFPVVPGSRWNPSTAAPSSSAGSSSSSDPSARSKWKRNRPRDGRGSTQATPPGTSTVPTPPTGATTPTNPGPTTGAPDPEPSTQNPEPTPTETQSPDPVPTEAPSTGGSSPAEPEAESAPAE
ncbi:hypothetical protein [Cryptosporangium arvum]|uniref:hypothetical protein n=1 Tax=Cryptosporangium arvum TaxID=80871 RepID=UPI0004B2CECF|nr:hypothetical protein [Cryptosporangium arvum]